MQDPQNAPKRRGPWRRIDDSPPLSDPPWPDEVAAMTALGNSWRRRALAMDDGMLSRCCAVLRRHAAVETGLLAKAYALDRRDIHALVRSGAPPNRLAGRDAEAAQRIAAAVANQHAALDMLLDVTEGPTELSPRFLRRLNGLFVRPHGDQASAASPYRTRAKRRARGGRPACCPPGRIAAEMKRLVALHDAHRHAGMPPAIASAWLCHRYTQICPFADGNGRMARSLAALAVQQAGWPPLLVRDLPEDRGPWLAALRAADDGDLGPLARWIAQRERAAMTWILLGGSWDEALAAAASAARSALPKPAVVAKSDAGADGGKAATPGDDARRRQLLQDLADGKLPGLSQMPVETLRALMGSALRERGAETADSGQWQDEMVDTVCHIVSHPGDPRSPLFSRSRALAERLSALTGEVLGEVQSELTADSDHIEVELLDRWDGPRQQVDALAGRLDYQARWQPFCAAHTLRVRACAISMDLTFILHGTSLQALGLLAGIGCARCCDADGEALGGAQLLTDSYYPICYLQPDDEALNLFRRWLMDCVRCGLRKFQALL